MDRSSGIASDQVVEVSSDGKLLRLRQIGYRGPEVDGATNS